MAVRSPHGPAPNTRHWGSGWEMETRTDEPRKQQKNAAAELHKCDKRQATETKVGFVLQAFQACLQEAHFFHF